FSQVLFSCIYLKLMSSWIVLYRVSMFKRPITIISISSNLVRGAIIIWTALRRTTTLWPSTLSRALSVLTNTLRRFTLSWMISFLLSPPFKVNVLLTIEVHDLKTNIYIYIHTYIHIYIYI